MEDAQSTTNQCERFLRLVVIKEDVEVVLKRLVKFCNGDKKEVRTILKDILSEIDL